MYKNFTQAFYLTMSAAFMYKVSLLLHQIFLYSVISHNLYGQQSTLFAALYLAIACTNFGFDEALLPFFSTYIQSKKQFNQCLRHFFIHISILLLITITAMIATQYYNLGALLHNLGLQCNKNIILILSGLFLVESIKKSVVTIMFMAFLNRQVAQAQLSMLLMYIASIWITYAYTGQINLANIFVPMLIFSSFELFYLAHIISNFYRRLSLEISAPNIPFKVLFMQRIFNYIQQLVKIIYNPNSMMLFFAYTLGFRQAATIKFFTNIITLVYTCIAKSLGVTAGAAFSSIDNKASMALFFNNITYRYVQILSIFASVMLTVITYAYYASLITQVMGYQILFFLTITFMEHISITYEQLLLSQHYAFYLACINSISLLLSIFCIALAQHHYYVQRICIFVSIAIKLISLYIVHKKIKQILYIK